MANMAVDMTTILLLEDDPAIAATLQFSLQREGWQVLWADMVAKVLPLLKHLAALCWFGDQLLG